MSATFLLDTCAWLDAFAAPELLRPAVRKLLAGERMVHVSAISLLEVARKEAKGELVFDRSLAKWFEFALPTHWVRVLEITPEIACTVSRCSPPTRRSCNTRMSAASPRARPEDRAAAAASCCSEKLLDAPDAGSRRGAQSPAGKHLAQRQRQGTRLLGVKLPLGSLPGTLLLPARGCLVPVVVVEKENSCGFRGAGLGCHRLCKNTAFPPPRFPNPPTAEMPHRMNGLMIAD
ncbi:MAG: hypothetical protein NTW21_26205 [Verrucomicrobia bacterium]|nr:hypothetical protein [Verrucomicrobiota bacterium]